MFVASSALFWAIATVFVALCGGTLARYVALRGAPTDVVRSRLDSLKTWWILAGLVSAAILCGKTGILILLAAAAILGLREFLRLVGREAVGAPTTIVVYLFSVAYFLLLFAGQGEWARRAAPVAFVVVIGGMRAVLGLIEGFVRNTAAIIWGLLLFVYCLSHAYLLLEISAVSEPPIGSVGWFLFLVLLTEANDIAQALVGRKFGKTKIVPRVSPNKSLQGLLGGMATTVILAVISAPWLTSLMQGRPFASGFLVSAIAGALISFFGFLGDINVSGMKRDVGVKDGSTLLPGQGGMIDRINSLTFTAPVFYYYIQIVQ
jgi:phosphatidate cytidylyltransferase